MGISLTSKAGVLVRQRPYWQRSSLLTYHFGKPHSFLETGRPVQVESKLMSAATATLSLGVCNLRMAETLSS